MAEMAVSFAIDQLLPLLTSEFNLLKGIHKEFADIKDELESIQAFLKDADKRAAAEGDSAASEIQDIKSYVSGIKERSERYCFQRSFEQGSNSSRVNQNAKWHDPRVAALYIDEADVVGFEAPKKRLLDWMVNGREERTVISVVGMGGQGKTTLAKKVLDNKDVIEHFDCRVWITVSQSYNVEGLLRDMLLKLYKQKGEDPPKDIFKMDRGSLTDEVRNYLQQKRYIVVFDDVWSVHFWDDIEFAVIDNKNGSKIFITTRNLDVVVSCKKSSFIEVLELQPLTQEQSLELFNKNAFKFEYGGCCPKELIGIANEIVKKCKGLPLAIVTIAGLLSTREKDGFEWQKFRENLSLELKKDTHLIGIKEILGLSYNDLPYYLKSCFLYFGIYPEDYEVKSKRMIQHWITEGFVKEEKGKTLEEVAEGYLLELVHRSLVQLSSVRIDGKAKSCRVHDLIRDVILEKIDDLNFCKHISGDGQSSLSGIIRRISITTASNNLFARIESSHVRSVLFFEGQEPYVDDSDMCMPTNYRLLKLLDYEFARLQVVKELGKLKQIRKLGLVYVLTKDGSILSSSINEMKHIEELFILSSNTIDEDFIDLHLISTPTMLRKLTLSGRLYKLPEWIPKLQNLVVLKLLYSNLTKDPMQSLKSLNHLLILSIDECAYEGLCLHFEDGCLQKLKELYVLKSDELRDIIIDKGALPSLKKLKLYGLFGLKNIPTGIEQLEEKLEALYFHCMLPEFVQDNSSTECWNWMMEHVPLVEICTIDEKTIRNSRS